MSADEASVIAGLEKAKIVPVVEIERAEDAVALCGALSAGGLNVAEITFRTEAAAGALAAVGKAYPDFLLGAGTVTRVEEVNRAYEAGADFAVAPGSNYEVLEQADVMGLPFFPGVCTPSDVEFALECGRSFLKFYPAEASGGVGMLSALYGPYAHRGVRFMPTGGISLGNLSAYLSHPGVSAVGGTWLVPKTLIETQDWSAIETLTREAVAAAEEAGV